MYPVAGQTYTTYITLEDVANPGLPKFAPTLDATNDFQLSINDGAIETLDNAPSVLPAGGPWVKIVFSAAETTAAAANGRIKLSIADAAGNQWYGMDLVLPVLAGGLLTDNVWTGAKAAFLDAAITAVLARVPAALVGGRIDASIGAIVANAITAAAIATDAIDADAIAANAVTEIQAGLATPTNITAGTITTVTNLTNAPTSGDLTATMKTSVTTAATAATPTAAAVTGAVGSVTAGVTLANDAITAAKIATGAIDADALATDAVAEITTALMAVNLESGKTFAQALLDLWAQAVGDAAADDEDNPTNITYDSPDGTVQVTHTHTDTTRTKV